MGLEGGAWSDERRSLHRQLQGLDPQLAGLYRHAIDLLSAPRTPGEEKARLALIGHCIRELINSIPDALGDVEGLPASGRQDEDRERDALVSAYEGFGGLDIDAAAVEDRNESAEQPRLVAVPLTLFEAVGRWATSVRVGASTVAQRDSAVVLGRIDTRDAALRPWKAARDFAMKITHFKRNYPLGSVPELLPSDDEVMCHLENIEASLRNRLGAFFDSLDELTDLIAQANELVDGDESE